MSTLTKRSLLYLCVFLPEISLQVKHVQFTRASDRVFNFFWYCVKTSQVMLDRLTQQWIDHARRVRE